MTNFPLLLPFIIFCIVMTATPGPNNAFVMISGAKFGLLKTIPLILGIAFGVGLQLLALAIGLNKVFQQIPQLHLIISIIGTIYIIWLAWKIASSGPLKTNINEKPSMGFLQGALFQWVNPKAWIVSISTIGTYFSINMHYIDILFASILLIIISIPCVGIWSIGGIYLRKLLTNIKFALVFNLTMSIALLLAVLPTTIKLITEHLR